MDDTKVLYFVMGCFIGGMGYAIWRNKQQNKTLAAAKQESYDKGFNDSGDQFMSFLGRCSELNVSAGQAKNALLNGGYIQ